MNGIGKLYEHALTTKMAAGKKKPEVLYSF
jgi:hypothetical protein